MWKLVHTLSNKSASKPPNPTQHAQWARIQASWWHLASNLRNSSMTWNPSWQICSQKLLCEAGCFLNPWGTILESKLYRWKVESSKVRMPTRTQMHLIDWNQQKLLYHEQKPFFSFKRSTLPTNVPLRVLENITHDNWIYINKSSKKIVNT